MLKEATSEMTRLPNEELERLKQRAIADRQEEPAFLRALLNSTVYAHVPISDDSGRLRFTQFARPDNGQVVLPFFIDESEAHVTAGNSRRVVALPGRTLFQHTLGATLIFDPNGVRCMLYAEEIKELLSTGFVANVDTNVIEKGREVLLEPLKSVPDWLRPAWAKLMPSLPFVEIAYVLISAPPEDPETHTLLIVLGVAAIYAERIGRALATALQAYGDELRLSVDMISYDPNNGRPELLNGIDIEPVYVRPESGGR